MGASCFPGEDGGYQHNWASRITPREAMFLDGVAIDPLLTPLMVTCGSQFLQATVAAQRTHLCVSSIASSQPSSDPQPRHPIQPFTPPVLRSGARPPDLTSLGPRPPADPPEVPSSTPPSTPCSFPPSPCGALSTPLRRSLGRESIDPSYPRPPPTPHRSHIDEILREHRWRARGEIQAICSKLSGERRVGRPQRA